ncbi:AAA family ATPase [Methylomicrobium lacus]|uniref:AAA family ATPase n=1 Tax=Methylomicrobium lacus TaxID=136992 RepID=UPI00045E6A8A|nr:ATP-binding protein [Methylomicrobium lacus]
MPTQAIQNLEITNFKCFKDLKVSGIGQVNLIGGKNNVGKTAFLEAAELFLSSKTASDLIFMLDTILKRRQNEIKYCELDIFYSNENNITLSTLHLKSCRIKRLSDYIDNSTSIGDKGLPTEGLSFFLKNEDGYEDEKSLPSYMFTKPESNDFGIDFWKKFSGIITYISSAKLNEQDIAILLGSLVDSDKEDFLNQSLSLFDPNIVSIKQITTKHGVVLKFKLKGQDNLVLLSSLGEGVNRYIAILCAIWANKDGFLLIDEIENGIHYTNYKKLWEIIFEASVAANCQLFITTHSKECISAFNDVQFENETCDTQYFEFYNNLKTGLIDASGIDKEQLRYSLTHEGRIRGE